MGLDQTAGWTDPQPLENVVNIDGSEAHKPLNDCYEWRKHARLQTFMQTLYAMKNIEDAVEPEVLEETGVPTIPEEPKSLASLIKALSSTLPIISAFNNARVELTETDVLTLKLLVEQEELPFCSDGFFWGQQFQEEAMKEYKEQDLEFCTKALSWIKDGKKVYYSPWF